MNRRPLNPEDLLAAAGCCREALTPALRSEHADGWQRPAAELTWSCRRTLDHIPDALAFYALHLATRAPARRPFLRDGDPAASPADLLSVVEGMAAVLAEVATAAPATVRGYHGAGMADPEGFVAMGCEEILIHTNDIARGFGLPFQPPAELTGRLLARLFPWAPTGIEPWDALRWASGRTALPDRERLGPDWYWHCAPLSEWDGQIKRRDSPPGWR